MRKIKLSLIIAIGAAIVSCESNTYQEISGVTTNPTYLGNIKPIVTANCTNCHSADGGQTPYLETYDQTKEAIQTGTLLMQIAQPTTQGMPQNERMPQEKIDMITTWAQNGFR